MTLKAKKEFYKKDGEELLPLVPRALILPLWFVALALPNLVYSGVRFADTLHIIKWAVAGAPVAIAVFVAGLRLLWYGRKRIRLSLDMFAVLWALLLIYCAAQPLWTKISSPTALAHEFICFATVWAFYVLSADSFHGLRPLLWLANVNGAVNVLFAELQIRGLNNLAFLQGTFLEFLRPLNSLILPTPGNYIGNTAQQNMFALWMAICVMSSIYLFIAYAIQKGGKQRPLWLTLLNLFLMGVNIWGLCNSTSRSGLLSLLVGLLVLGLVVAFRFGRAYIKRMGTVLLLFLAVLGGLLVASPERSTELIKKTVDILQNVQSVGGRRGIWTTSSTMFKEHPMGVGIGQYKWHYLEAQREAFKTHDDLGWQYTHWAHNEFLQWFCEGGVIGGAMLVLMYALWLAGVVRGLILSNREGKPVPPETIWACALVALISFNALWTRPFHRIENILWLALAFALTNREFLGRSGRRLELSEGFSSLAGAACVCASLAGLLYLGSGIQGNLLLRQALSTQRQGLQFSLLQEAGKHPVVWEEVQRNLGYHFLQVGDQTQDLESMGRGFDLLWGHFQREPHSEDMSKLLQWAQRFQAEDVIRELASYLKPGSYHLVRRLETDSAGHQRNALIVVNGPAPVQ